MSASRPDAHYANDTAKGSIMFLFNGFVVHSIRHEYTIHLVIIPSQSVASSLDMTMDVAHNDCLQLCSWRITNYSSVCRAGCELLLIWASNYQDRRSSCPDVAMTLMHNNQRTFRNAGVAEVSRCLLVVSSLIRNFFVSSVTSLYHHLGVIC